MDFGREVYQFRTLATEVQMIHTKTGHIGFHILEGEETNFDIMLKLDWSAFANSNQEIAFGKQSQDRVQKGIPHVIRGPTKKGRRDSKKPCSDSDPKQVHACFVDSVLSSGKCPADSKLSDSCARSDGTQSGSSEEEGGVRCSPCGDDVDLSAGAERDDHGEVESHLSIDQAKEDGKSASRKLAQVLEERAAEAVCGEGDAMVPDSSLRSYSSGLESRSTDRGIGQLCGGGTNRRTSEPDRASTRCTSDMPKVSHPHDREDEPSGWRQVLGMFHIPSVQRNSRQAVRREGDSGSAKQWLPQVGKWFDQGDGDRRFGEHGWSVSPSCEDTSSSKRCELGSGIERISTISAAEQVGEAAHSGAPSGQGEVNASEWVARPEAEHEIRKKIRIGQAKRRQARRGTLKRLAGNCIALAAASVMYTSAVLGVVASGCNSVSSSLFGDNRVDVIEIFGGSAEISLQFAQRGWNVIQPIDLQYGHDLRDSAVRDEVLQLIDKECPRLVLVEWPCRFWGKLVDVNYSTPQRKRLLNRLREAERPFLEFTEEVFKRQIKRGDDALAENPLASHAFKEPPISCLLGQPGIFVGVSHGCRFNVRHVDTQELLKKPTAWISTSQEIADELSLRCENSHGHVTHTHGRCEGKRVTEHAGRYTPEIARAIHRGFVKLMKRKDPSRIATLLKGVRKRLGKPDHGLKWTLESLGKVERETNQTFMTANTSAGDPSPEMQSGNQLGVSFEIPAGRKLDPGARSLIKKLHCNLGHPSTRDLQRFLRNGGAPQDVIEAVGWIKCAACAQTQRPRLHRSVRLPPHDLQFNDQVMVDCFHIKDPKSEGHWFMSMLDRSTMYHLVTYIPNHSPQTFVDVFFRDWVKWAGNPIEVSIDLERGFSSQLFASSLGEAGIQVVPVAGQAHWQHGKVERHGSILKDMLTKVLVQNSGCTPEEVSWMANEVTMAKNALAREHGFSPSQLLFGKEPRLYGEVEENGEPCVFHFSVGDRGTQLAKRMRYRNEARQEYIRSQAQRMLNQTARNKTRAWKEPQIGDRCFFFREIRNKGTKGVVRKWLGPALVVGLQGQSNLWLVFGGKCFLVAQEHTREATGEEVLYGKPEVQQALSLFKGMQGSTYPQEYTDLTKEKKPGEDDLDMSIGDDDPSDDEMIPVDHPGNPNRIRALPDEYLPLCHVPGWKEDILGNPVNVGYKSYTYRGLSPKYDVTRFPYRSSWGYWDGKWRLLEDEIRWGQLEDVTDLILGGPADILVTVFKPRTRKQVCNDSVPECIKKRRTNPQQVFMSLSQRKAQKALDKEVPLHKIPECDKAAYRAAEEKEWKSWLDYDAVEVLDAEASAEVLRTKRERVLKSRYVFRNKNAGLVDSSGNALPLRAKARLCVQGQNCPDCMSGEVKVDAPTVQHASLTLFLHLVASFGWISHWRNGDISSAFLQGEESKGAPLYMFPPVTGLPGISPDQVLRLKRPVYGRPDAPRAWYEQISSFIMRDMGYTRSLLDPALFVHRDKNGKPNGLLVLHVDDLMIATDGSPEVETTVDMLYKRFPFGEWALVKDSPEGVTYCGKELVVEREVDGEEVIRMRQRGFVDGRLELVPIDKERKTQPDLEVTPAEKSDFRSVIGSLQWLTNQTRVDINFQVNQLQKRINHLTVADLLEINKLVRIVKQNEVALTFRNLGTDCAVVVWHDSALFNSVGCELEDGSDEYVQEIQAKRKIYSQKACVVGLVRRDDLERTDAVPCNFVAWRSKTNRRIVESSFAGETHGALLGHAQGHHLRVLLSEICYGENIVKSSEEEWGSLITMVMCTDCRSVFDHVKKDSQSVGDKANAIHTAVLRQLCTAEKSPVSNRARLLWIPTRHQIADGLTKSGLHHVVQQILSSGLVTFHAKSAKALMGKKSRVSVNS